MFKLLVSDALSEEGLKVLKDEKELQVDVKLKLPPEELKAIINSCVIEKLDHKNLNLDVEFMRGKMATTELLCMEIFNQLKDPIEAYNGVFLHSVKLAETENNYAEYFGNG